MRSHRQDPGLRTRGATRDGPGRAPVGRRPQRAVGPPGRSSKVAERWWPSAPAGGGSRSGPPPRSALRLGQAGPHRDRSQLPDGAGEQPQVADRVPRRRTRRTRLVSAGRARIPPQEAVLDLVESGPEVGRTNPPAAQPVTGSGHLHRASGLPGSQPRSERGPGRLSDPGTALRAACSRRRRPSIPGSARASRGAHGRWSAPHREDEADGLSLEGGERRRRAPARRADRAMGIVDQADERALLRGSGRRAPHPQAHQEAFRRLGAAQAERRTERVALRGRQPSRRVSIGAHSGEGPRTAAPSRTRPRGAGDAAAGGAQRHVLEELRLPHAGLAPKHEHLAPPGADRLQRAIQDPPLVTPTEQHVTWRSL